MLQHLGSESQVSLKSGFIKDITTGKPNCLLNVVRNEPDETRACLIPS